jgi:anti-anti-sigma factor
LPAALQIEQTVIWTESLQIRVSGELDLACVDALRQLLADTVGSGLSCIVLDLSTCEFLDAGALGVISGLQLQLAANGQELLVHGATGQVERLIELARAISHQVCVNETT